MRSTVHLTDRLTNAERRFGSADAYVPVRVELPDGTEAVALMTEAPFLEGIKRAEANPEDVERAVAIAELRAQQGAKAMRRKYALWASNVVLVACAAFAIALVWALVG